MLDHLKSRSHEMGGALFGVADLTPHKDRFLLSDAELNGLIRGIVVGVVLSPAILAGIENQPTLLYKWHYRQANNLLDRIAFVLTQDLIAAGFRALPVAASQTVDRKMQRGHVSHRALAEAAGLGWRGRNNLLVHPVFGSRVRLVSILTDLDVGPGTPLPFGCGACHRCVNVCPAGALGETPEAYDLSACYDCLTTFSRINGIGQHICGICVKACPGWPEAKMESESK